MATQPPVPVLQPWALARLRNVVSTHPSVRFEASIFGPLLLLLFTIFPPTKRFITKPQGLLRAPLETGGDILADTDNAEHQDSDDEDEQVEEEPYDDDNEYRVESENAAEETASADDTSMADEDFTVADPNMEEQFPVFDGDISTDSYNSPTASRNVRGSYKNTFFADFLVAKGGESLTGDKLVLVIEVKKNRTNRRDARSQIQTYLLQARRKNRDSNLNGMLVIGKRTEQYTLSGPGNDAFVIDGPVFETTSESLRNLLHGIAVAYA